MIKIEKNQGSSDRFLRIIAGEILLLLGFFWFGGIWQIILYILGALLVVLGIIGFSVCYKILGINTNGSKLLTRKNIIVLSILILVILFFGSFLSILYTKKIFVNDFNKMNHYLKQTLYHTGQNNRAESIANFVLFNHELDRFEEKYVKFHPLFIKQDEKFNEDLINISNSVAGLRGKVLQGNLPQAHIDFEGVRASFIDILKRNKIPTILVPLMAFHDVMEPMVDAAKGGDADAVRANYEEADAALKELEKIINDDDVKMIRKNLEELNSLAAQGKTAELPNKGAELKAAYSKFYLQKG